MSRHNSTIQRNSEYRDLQIRTQRYYGKHWNTVLVKLIDEKGWTFEQLADFTGTTKQYIHKQYTQLKREQKGGK